MKLFNLKKIEQSFISLKNKYHTINNSLTLKRDDFNDKIIENIILAYEYVNELLKSDVNLFNPAGLYSMLELNHIILCGNDPEKRIEYHDHINETRQRFYKNIESILVWYKKKKKNDPYDIAVGFYIRALSQPQLFFEGNHRTENIVLNYILVGYNQKPFILNEENAFDYFEHSAKIKHSNREHISSFLLYMQIKKNIISILKNHGKNDFFYH